MLPAHQPQNFQAWMVQGASMTRGTASLVYLRAAVRPTLMIQADAKPPSMLTTSGIRHTMQHEDVCDDGMHAALSQHPHCIMHCHLRHSERRLRYLLRSSRHTGRALGSGRCTDACSCSTACKLGLLGPAASKAVSLDDAVQHVVISHSMLMAVCLPM